MHIEHVCAGAVHKNHLQIEIDRSDSLQQRIEGIHNLVNVIFKELNEATNTKGPKDGHS